MACVPNIQHYSVIVNLLRGNWKYEAEGLLDRTHLRFFTLDGIQELFASAGLRVHDVRPRWWNDSGFDRFREIMAPVLDPLGIDANRFATQTRAVQYLVRAVRAGESSQGMIIWSLLGSLIGSEVRIQEPLRFLATIPGVRVQAGISVLFADLGRTLPGEQKVFLQQRVVIPQDDHQRLQRALLAIGYLIVAELDDDPLHFDGLVKSDFFALRSCHCVQTANTELAELLRAYNPYLEVFPNQLASLPPLREAPAGGVDSQANPVTLFFGALNRETDWAPLMPVLNRVLARHEGKVRVQVVHDRAFHDALELDARSFEPLCAYERYHELLHAAEVAWLPLEPTRFNGFKSDLKFLECAGHGVAVLASPTVYGRVIRHDETGLIYDSREDFEAHLNRLIVDAPGRRRLAENARCYVAENRLLSRHFRRREVWHRCMAERLPALNQQLRERAPELF